ncbi:MAG: hypothetical protein AAFV29_16140 [Myxococcota bacterium]
MTEEQTQTRPRRWLFRPRNALIVFLVLVAVGLISFGLSLYNSQKFFLIVEATHVRVAKGRFLPFGRRPFIPREAGLREAYRTVPLISGMKLSRGSSTFMDRVELDQALYRLLKDATAYSLTKDDPRSGELTAKYLTQLDALPGLSAAQRQRVAELRRDAEYIEGQALVRAAVGQLEQAEEKFSRSAKGGKRYQDGAQQAQRIRRALTELGHASVPPEASLTTPKPQIENPIAPSSPTRVVTPKTATTAISRAAPPVARVETSSTSTVP